MTTLSIDISYLGVPLTVFGWYYPEEKEWFDYKEGVGNPREPAWFEIEKVEHAGQDITSLLECMTTQGKSCLDDVALTVVGYINPEDT